ncbi:MAG: VanZ family protein, partial [Lachnospiraceae bacterium]|nr:VanZ family protein [Lachnospiraceae bacterium]
MIKFLKPLSFIPAILLMYMIFSFSAQEGTVSSDLSYKVSYKIIEAGSI